MTNAWIDYQALEQAIPLDDLPRFQRALLALHQPERDWQAAPLRQVQGKTQAALKQLEREGLAQTTDRLWMAEAALPKSFASYYGPLRRTQ